jgi:hypothetical protein
MEEKTSNIGVNGRAISMGKLKYGGKWKLILIGSK